MAAFSYLSGNRFLTFFLLILEVCRLCGDGFYEFSMGARVV